jgi:phage terminase large subunit-like protein
VPDGTTEIEGTPEEVRALLAEPPVDAVGKMLPQTPFGTYVVRAERSVRSTTRALVPAIHVRGRLGRRPLACRRRRRVRRRRAAVLLVTPVASVDRPLGKYERLARERHERDLELTRQPGGHPRGLRFDQKAADRVVEFVERFCRHYEGELAHQLVKLEEWQKGTSSGPIFGWKRADGTRRYRTAYIEIPRKNGKSFLCSALALYLLVADGEPGAQIYSRATKEEQAVIVWRGAATMAKASTELGPYVREHTSKGGTLYCDKMGSFYKPLGADSRTLDGMNPHAQIVDELHEHKDRRVWSKLQTGKGARRQPLTIAITTAGVFDPTAVGWQEHEYATQVLEGAFEDDSRFAFIAAADEGDDVFSTGDAEEGEPELRRLGVRVRARGGRSARRPAAGDVQRLSPLPAEPLDAAGDALDPAGEVGRAIR